jgi:hypothetical protein
VCYRLPGVVGELSDREDGGDLKQPALHHEP